MTHPVADTMALGPEAVRIGLQEKSVLPVIFQVAGTMSEVSVMFWIFPVILPLRLGSKAQERMAMPM